MFHILVSRHPLSTRPDPIPASRDPVLPTTPLRRPKRRGLPPIDGRIRLRTRGSALSHPHWRALARLARRRRSCGHGWCRRRARCRVRFLSFPFLSFPFLLSLPVPSPLLPTLRNGPANNLLMLFVPSASMAGHPPTRTINTPQVNGSGMNACHGSISKYDAHTTP